MSFRNRLTLFFVLIVLVPMISVAVVLFRLLADTETGRADQALRAQSQLVVNLYDQARRNARPALEEVAGDVQFGQALREGDVQAAKARARELLAATEDVPGEPIKRIRLVEDGEPVFAVGQSDAIAPATGRLDGGFGRLQVSVTSADGFTRRVKRLVGAEGAVRVGGRLATTLEDVRIPRGTGVRTIQGPEGEDLRVFSRDVPGFGSNRPVISVLAPRDRGTVDESRLLAGAILLGFFVLALAFALAVSRQLQQQVAGLLDAARRLGAGDFSAKVPTEGRDEFAALGEEFNKMSEQLAARSEQLATRMEELGHERERVQASVRRLGEAMGSNLDRDVLLGIVLATALEGVGGHAGRVTIRPGGDAPMEEAASAGDVRGLDAVLREAESRVLGSEAFAEVTAGGRSALAQPLFEGDEEHRRAVGVVSVARTGPEFVEADRELFQYLAGQAAVSIENVDLHEAVARESITDELTGLANRRRFFEALRGEVERSRRFGGRVGLIMGDIDDFKVVNDTRGHLQGDEVLREVARVLRERSRDIDVPARYGGEELAVVLPGTDLDGACELAQRMRSRIEELTVGAVDGGRPVGVTASFGVASLPEVAGDAQSLVAAADRALLEAKRAGKNRVVSAPERGRPG